MRNDVMVDTSVWIDYYKGHKTPETLSLYNIFEKDIIILPPIIIQEVLQGVVEKKMVAYIESSFYGFKFISYDAYEAAFGAAHLYTVLRQKGVTIKSSNDILIAWLAINNDISILHKDRDFENIAKHTSLKIYKS